MESEPPSLPIRTPLGWEIARLARKFHRARRRLVAAQAILIAVFVVAGYRASIKPPVPMYSVLIDGSILAVVHIRTTAKWLEPGRLRDMRMSGLSWQELWQVALVAPGFAWIALQILRVEWRMIDFSIAWFTDRLSLPPGDVPMIRAAEEASLAAALAALSLWLLVLVPLAHLRPSYAIAFPLGAFTIPTIALFPASLSSYLLWHYFPGPVFEAPIGCLGRLLWGIGCCVGYLALAHRTFLELLGPACMKVYEHRLGEVRVG